MQCFVKRSQNRLRFRHSADSAEPGSQFTAIRVYYKATLGGKSGNISLDRSREKHLTVHSWKNQNRFQRSQSDKQRCQHVITKAGTEFGKGIGRSGSDDKSIGPFAKRYVAGIVSARTICRGKY